MKRDDKEQKQWGIETIRGTHRATAPHSTSKESSGSDCNTEHIFLTNYWYPEQTVLLQTLEIMCCCCGIAQPGTFNLGGGLSIPYWHRSYALQPCRVIISKLLLLNCQRGNEIVAGNSALAVKAAVRMPREVCGTFAFLAPSAQSFTHCDFQMVVRDNLTRVSFVDFKSQNSFILQSVKPRGAQDFFSLSFWQIGFFAGVSRPCYISAINSPVLRTELFTQCPN